jgi:hypothetical protein
LIYLLVSQLPAHRSVGQSPSHGHNARDLLIVSVGEISILAQTLTRKTRLAKRALELKRPVMMLNVGPTRTDGLPGVTKIELPTGFIMRDVVRGVL